MARFVLPGGTVVEARDGGDLAKVYRRMGAKPDYGTPPPDDEQPTAGASETEETANPSSSE